MIPILLERLSNLCYNYDISPLMLRKGAEMRVP